MPQSEDRRMEGILHILFPKGSVPLEIAEQLPAIKMDIRCLLHRAGAYDEGDKAQGLRIGPVSDQSKALNERIMNLKAEGLNFVQIAVKINEEGHRTTVGNKFTGDACRKRWVAYDAFLNAQKKQARDSTETNLVPGYLGLVHLPEPTPGPRLVTLSVPETLPEEPKADPEIIKALEGDDIPLAGATATELQFNDGSCARDLPASNVEKLGKGHPKIPHLADEEINNLRESGKTLKAIVIALGKRGISCNEMNVSDRLEQIKSGRCKKGVQPKCCTSDEDVHASDELAINRTIRDMHERGKTDIEISVYLSNNVGGPWLPDEVARRLKEMGARK